MKLYDNNEIINGAIQIGDDILKTSIKYKELTWSSYDVSDNKIVSRKTESLYSGTAGVIYFLLELYQRTKHNKYLDAVLTASRGLEVHCHQHKAENYTFYTGRTGVIYLYLKMSKILGDEYYKKLAIRLSKSLLQSKFQFSRVDDLINGNAGTLLGLLHLHSETKIDSLLKVISEIAKHLISRININDRGIYWDRSGNSISGLCGYSHGVSGLAYVFLELGRYFNNETFYQIAELAFSYENEYFLPTSNNWADLRRGHSSRKNFLKYKYEYENNNKVFFQEHGEMSAWCHGAPGIGLSRIRAFELLKKETYLIDLSNAIQNTKQCTINLRQEGASFTLCHGRGGNALLFKEAVKVFPDKEIENWSQLVANEAMLSFKKERRYKNGIHIKNNKKDPSLFLGNAGIGYFYLIASESLSQSTILKPDVDGTCKDLPDILSLEKVKLVEFLVDQRYPTSSKFIKGRIINQIESNLTSIKELDNKASSAALSLKSKEVRKNFEFDKSIIKFEKGLPSDSYLYIQQIIELEKNQNLLGKSLSEWTKVTLTMSEYIQILTKPELDRNQAKRFVLIPSPTRLQKFEVTEFFCTVITVFKKPHSVDQAIKQLMKKIRTKDHSERESVYAAIISQMSEALKMGVLRISNYVTNSNNM